ncbi:MAG: 2-oxoglutarate dehydrogenase E1 component, partial [Alphaproteobacteria bacterium]
MKKHAPNDFFDQTSFLHGINAAYIEDLYARFQENPGAVSADWRSFFTELKDRKENVVAEANGPSWKREDWPPAGNGELITALSGGDWPELAGRHLEDRIAAAAQANGFELSSNDTMLAVRDSVRALMLIRSYRVRGHLAADLDPLQLAKRLPHSELQPETYGFQEPDYDRPIYLDGVLGLKTASIRQIMQILRRTYCAKIGMEFMHISVPEQKSWIQERMEGVDKEINFTEMGKRAIFNKLVEAETFEKFLDKRYTGTKRFGIDGGEAMIPALEQIIKRGGQLGVREIVLGMSHRGRLNVLATVLCKPYRAIFNEFRGGSSNPDDIEGSGDVKYHLGASHNREFDGNRVHLSLTANPSHLEAVDPVVLGKVRAKQEQYADKERTQIMPLLIHGDAAFAGQGVVAECFGLSGLAGHRTGGSVHFIINNQIGFTTSPHYGRSSPYPSDVARMIEAPILHVNGDDPEAVVHVAKVAAEFRQKFHKPVVIDMFCYRRHGHNEGDEPSFTQPLMYKRIKQHPRVSDIYAERLVNEGLIENGEVDRLREEMSQRLEDEFKAGETYRPNQADWLDGRWSGIAIAEEGPRKGTTGVALDTLRTVGKQITTIPVDFKAHRTIERLFKARRQMVDEGEGIDWAMAEAL